MHNNIFKIHGTCVIQPPLLIKLFI